jgi:transposase-like protein
MPTFEPGQPGRIVLTISADAVLDPELSDGAVRLLLLIRSLAGHSRRLVTLTQSLATALNRSTNTIREWRDQLEEGGYISHRTDGASGRTTILLLEAVEPPSRRAALAAQREIDAKPAALPWQPQPAPALKPDPAPWGKPPQPRPWRVGAQRGAHIKPRKILSPVPLVSVPPREGAGTASGTRIATPAEPMSWAQQCASAARQLAALGMAIPASWCTH